MAWIIARMVYAMGAVLLCGASVTIASESEAIDEEILLVDRLDVDSGLQCEFYVDDI